MPAPTLRQRRLRALLTWRIRPFAPWELLAAAIVVAVLGLIAEDVFVLGAPAGTPPCWVLPFAPHEFRLFGFGAC
jgi:hypothetical protein